MATSQPQLGSAPPAPAPASIPASAPGSAVHHGVDGAADNFSTPSSYKRASRKGAPKRFSCTHPGCDKLYSRAEHLQRHQLNHAPKEIFLCDVPGCDQKFVRADLLARHKKRHSSSYTPRNRALSSGSLQASTESTNHGGVGPGTPLPLPAAGEPPRPRYPPQTTGGPHDAAILLAAEPSNEPPPAAMSKLQSAHPTRMTQPTALWHSQPMEGIDVNSMRPSSGYYGSDHPPPSTDTPGMLPFANVGFQPDAQLSENFAAWLFDAQAGFNELNSVADIPFLEGGLESTFNNNIHYDYESLTSTSPLAPTPPHQLELSDDLISDHRRREILSWFQSFRSKQPDREASIASLVQGSPGGVPGLSTEMLQACLHEYWVAVSTRLPIIHKPTFSCNRCPVHLLMVMLALGAASLRAKDSAGAVEGLGGFADVIITSIRWEILTADEASPPVGLWVAQALLLLEFYEKMYSSRKLHERAHIYHSATLTLLRRGSPLIGRAGSESPPEEQQHQHQQALPPPISFGAAQSSAHDFHTWWIRWAETESMQRVVFGAFMMDVIHAAMFGHLADMAPHEIRLPLPCDDNLWAAPTPESFRQVDSQHRMYGIKQTSFLDGLKSALHCNPVKTHAFGRMIIMSGLLSVGWHLSYRESHLKWLDRATPPPADKDDWRDTLLKAFDVWKDSFDRDIGTADLRDGSGSSNGPIHSASALYHLAHIGLHVDIVNCQVFAGVKRLLGRKVSTRDYVNSVSRMKSWATLASTRHAILHAFKLLHRVLVVEGRFEAGHQNGFTHVHVHGSTPITTREAGYSCRHEPDPHRPWILYYAALSICTFVRALESRGGARGHVATTQWRPMQPYLGLVPYLSRVAGLRELDDRTARELGDGLPELLRVLQGSLEGTRWEILQEARERLSICRDMLVGRPA